MKQHPKKQGGLRSSLELILPEVGAGYSVNWTVTEDEVGFVENRITQLNDANFARESHPW